MRYHPSSLRGRLLLWLGVGLSALWLALALWLHGEVRDRVATVLDQRLAASARMVASLLDADSDLAATLSGAGALPSGGIACEISGLRGEVLARSGGAPDDALALPRDGFGERLAGGHRWRVYTVTQGAVRVTSAERMAGRTDFMRHVAWLLLAALSAGLLASLTLVYWAVGRALAPLSSLRRQLAERDAGEQRPLSAPVGAVELAAMVATLNQLLSRERAALARERQLTDDLAHELRTPLAAIRTQLQVAKIAHGERAEHARSVAEQASQRLGHSLDQLLALAREDGTLDDEGVPLVVLVDELLEEQAQAIGQRGLRVCRRDQGAGTPAAPTGLVRISLRNVIENAVRHSPEGARLTVVLSGSGAECAARIEDQGAGMSPQQRHQALERGWHNREGGRREGGQGLGLAIVATVMARTGGTVTLSAGAEGGLAVNLRWPRAGTV